MIYTHNHKGLVWLELRSPSDDEISGLVRRYALSPLVGEELKDSPSAARVRFYKDYIFAIITIPVRTRKGNNYEIVDRELDFVIGKNFLITSCSDTIEHLEYFSKIFDTNAVLDKDTIIDHAGHLFYLMIKRIYSGMYQDLENIRDALRDAEESIFNGNEKAMVERLSNLSRELIDFKQTAHLHHDIWTELAANAEKDTIFGADFHAYAHSIKEESSYINEQIVNARELLADLRETNDSLLNSKQNEIIKVLTLVSFIFYPLTFIASLFTIPGVNVPLTQSPADWWILAVVMLVVALGIWFLFKRRGWLK